MFTNPPYIWREDSLFLYLIILLLSFYKEFMSKPNKTNKVRPQKKEATDTCNAWAKDHYCNNPAGMGTQHVGNGRCKFHGGASTGRPKKSFLASQYLNSDFLRVLEDISGEDPEAITKLDNEIHVIRTGFYEYAKECVKRREVFDSKKMMQFVGSLVKLIEAKAKLEGKISQQRVPTEMIVYYINQVTPILKRHCPPDLLKRISADMKEINLETLQNRGERSPEFN